MLNYTKNNENDKIQKIKEQNSKEQNSKEQNNKEQNSKEQNNKEQNNKEQNIEEQNSKEHKIKEQNIKEQNIKEQNIKTQKIIEQNNKNNKYNKRKIGSEYENKASEYLYNQGYKILAQNIFTPFGEIDLLAEEGATLIFCEIKYRSSFACGDPLEAVDYRKQKKICKSALYVYSKNGYYNDRPCRFDVIAIYKNDKIVHIKNAFEFFM